MAPSPRTITGSAISGAFVALLSVSGPSAAQTPPLPGSGPDGPTVKHEPVFGIGPQTLWDGGIGAGVETHASRHATPDGDTTEEELELHGHLDYGVTENLTVRMAMPLVKRKTETTLLPGGPASSSATGVGDLLVRAKYRFWHRFSGSTQYHASVMGGAEFPTASSTTEPQLSPGGTDYLAGATVSRDGLRYYLWASGIARMNGGVFGGSREDEYRYDAAFGYRPWVPSFTGVDPLLLLEFNGVTVTRDEGGAGGGGTILALSPGVWLTYRNFAFKGGVKLPVYQDVGGGMELDYALVVELEIHAGG